jgi:hypothetical protein
MFCLYKVHLHHMGVGGAQEGKQLAGRLGPSEKKWLARREVN